MKNEHLIKINLAYYVKKSMNYFYDIEDIITLYVYDDYETEPGCECKYCKQVLAWLWAWEDNFDNYLTCPSDNVSFDEVHSKVKQLVNYLTKHQIFACDEDCLTWNDERLNKLVYISLPELVKDCVAEHNKLSK